MVLERSSGRRLRRGSREARPDDVNLLWALEKEERTTRPHEVRVLR